MAKKKDEIKEEAIKNKASLEEPEKLLDTFEEMKKLLGEGEKVAIKEKPKTIRIDN